MAAHLLTVLPAAQASPGAPDIVAIGLMAAGAVMILAFAIAGGVIERRLRARSGRRRLLPPLPDRVVLPPHPDDIPGGLTEDELGVLRVIAARIVLQLDDLEEN